MDKQLMKKIEETSFLDARDIKRLFAECAGTEMSVLSNGSLIKKDDKEKEESLVIFRFRPMGIMTETVRDGKIRGHVLGASDSEALADVFLCKNNKICGVLRKKDDLYVVDALDEIGAGELCEVKRESVLSDTKAYCTDSASAVLYLALKLAQSENAPNIALVNESLAGTGGLTEVMRGLKPKNVIVVSAEAENDTFKVGGGVGIVIKDGCCTVSEKCIKDLKNAAECGAYQLYLGKTDNGLERAEISVPTESFGGIYIAVGNKKSGICEISSEDVKKTVNLLLKIKDTFDII